MAKTAIENSFELEKRKTVGGDAAYTLFRMKVKRHWIFLLPGVVVAALFAGIIYIVFAPSGKAPNPNMLSFPVDWVEPIQSVLVDAGYTVECGMGYCDIFALDNIVDDSVVSPLINRANKYAHKDFWAVIYAVGSGLVVTLLYVFLLYGPAERFFVTFGDRMYASNVERGARIIDAIRFAKTPKSTLTFNLATEILAWVGYLKNNGVHPPKIDETLPVYEQVEIIENWLLEKGFIQDKSWSFYENHKTIADKAFDAYIKYKNKIFGGKNNA